MKVNDRIIKGVDKLIYLGSLINSKDKIVGHTVCIYTVPTSH
jgi:hypothetical protein